MNEFKPIIWDANFNTKISEVDEQHRILVNTINEASATLNDNQNAKALEQIVNDLLSYALYHFETEEELMNKYDYETMRNDEYIAHLEQHRSFAKTVVDVKNDIKIGKYIQKDELLNFLKNWLTNHILFTDKKFGEYVNDSK